MGQWNSEKYCRGDGIEHLGGLGKIPRKAEEPSEGRSDGKEGKGISDWRNVCIKTQKAISEQAQLYPWLHLSFAMTQLGCLQRCLSPIYGWRNWGTRRRDHSYAGRKLVTWTCGSWHQVNGFVYCTIQQTLTEFSCNSQHYIQWGLKWAWYQGSTLKILHRR
jgi:hypothetical protein